MIKILILFAVIVCTTLVGAMLSGDKKKKMKVFDELYEFNERLLLNIKFGKASPEKLAADFEYVPKILLGDSVLGGEEGAFIESYVQNIGVTDALSQIDYLTERKTYLKKYKDSSMAEYKKYGSLYVKIFFMIGILIAVLLF